MYMNPTINQQVTGLQVFYNENENVSIRTDVINGEPWFVAKDVAMALDIDWSGKTLKSIPDGWKTMGSFPIYVSEDAVTGARRTTFINESAMYKLAFRSNKPEADRFVNWIAGSVLPSIRRTGSYSSNGVQTPVKESKKLPLPKYRPYYQDWKDKVTPYLCADDGRKVAEVLEVSYSHVRKVYMGTSVSAPVARMLTARAKVNRENGVRYEAEKPVYEQLSIEWEKEEVK